ncbi:MAG: 16S rRNA (uracil(1498)-N(3))-methyltransferase [Candidatus Omnitrophica bacterium]|nr:16S rRNA (uracil(1498)-N(3))-methyltransferase [Candidatus Omnitrophota bacterium]
MNRFFISPDNIKDGKAYFENREMHHILDVLRIRPNEKIVFFDGTGNEYTGILKRDKNRLLFANIIHKKNVEKFRFPRITLSQAIPKKEKMDWIIEKATELNVDTIIPIITERCLIRKNEEVLERYTNRWRKIAISASKQCGRVVIPTIVQPKKFLDIAKDANINYKLAIFATLSDKRLVLKEILSDVFPDSIIVFVGPEGDFTEKEIRLAKDFNLAPVNISPLTLRVETASIFLLSVLNFKYMSYTENT